MASPAAAARGFVKGRGGRCGQRSGRRGTGGGRAPTARVRFHALASPATRISPGTGIGVGAEAAARVSARVAAHARARGAKGARPVAIRVRATAATWNGPPGHSQVQTRLVGGTTALIRPRIHAGIPATVTAPSHPRVRARVPARVTATRHPRVAARARVTASGGIAWA